MKYMVAVRNGLKLFEIVDLPDGFIVLDTRKYKVALLEFRYEITYLEPIKEGK